MEAMELKSMDLDKFGEFKHADGAWKIKLWNFDGFRDSFDGVFNENKQGDQFWKKFIFGSFDLRGVFWELQKSVRFLEKPISGKIVADFQSFKTS